MTLNDRISAVIVTISVTVFVVIIVLIATYLLGGGYASSHVLPVEMYNG